MSREISFAGGPAHGRTAPSSCLILQVPVAHPREFTASDVDYCNPYFDVSHVSYSQRVFIVNDQAHRVFVPESMNEAEMAYHIGRLVGAREQSMEGGG